MSILGLPIEIMAMIAAPLRDDPADLAALARAINMEWYEVCRRQLYDHAVVMTWDCDHPNRPVQHIPCAYTPRRFLETVLRFRGSPNFRCRTLTLMADLTLRCARNHSPQASWNVIHPLDARHIMNTVIDGAVRALFPNRPIPANDWLTFLWQDNAEALFTAMLVLLPRIQNLSLSGPDPSRTFLPLLNVLQDINNNLPHNPNTPFRFLQSLEFGTSTIPWPVQSNLYNFDLAMLPTSLRELKVGYGHPWASQPITNITKLVIYNWACRIMAGADTSMHTVIHPNDRHMSVHFELIALLSRLPNLEEFEMENCRLCNGFLAQRNFVVLGQPAPGNTTMIGLPNALRQLGGTLRSIRIVSSISAINANHGIWLYRWFLDHMGSWAVCARLQTLETDSWLFFPGSADPQNPTIPNGAVNSHYLPAAIRQVCIRNLVDDYLNQFYDWLQLVIVARQGNGLPYLQKIEYSLLRVQTDRFPLAVRPMTIIQLWMVLRGLGIELIQL